MISLRRHEPEDYARFPHIDVPGVGELTDDDRLCLAELGEYVVGREASDRFGASLLHRHFDLNEAETLVEDVDRTARRLRLQPVIDARSDLSAVSLSFNSNETNGEDLSIVGLEYASPAALGPVMPIGQDDWGILQGFRDILAKHNKLQRFGLRLLHDPLDCGEDVLSETCNLSRRQLTCSVVSREDPALERSIQTVFRWKRIFKLDDDGLIAAQECLTICKRYCNSVIGQGHTEGHDETHPEGPQ